MTSDRQPSEFGKYVELAQSLGAVGSVIISPRDIAFDIRAVLKCRWGCDEDFMRSSIKCGTRQTTFQERVAMIRRYERILLVHSHNAGDLSRTVLEIERRAFLDGLYFAFAVRACNLCAACAVQKGGPCPHPEKVRPCDQSFGIDVYKTARNLGLPCEVLHDRTDTQNRYGFVLLE
jgi:predicted metal-binding protein